MQSERICKFCGKKQERPLSKGYCVSCYHYFILYKYAIWPKSNYGQLNRVLDIRSRQFGMPICHICGRAYAKLQQHIWYSHNMTREEYCQKYGLDKNINMTSKEYNEKMHNYALYYKMDDQLRKVGKNTRFKKGNTNNYKRSYQTKLRLQKHGKYIANLKEDNKNEKS